MHEIWNQPHAGLPPSNVAAFVRQTTEHTAGPGPAWPGPMLLAGALDAVDFGVALVSADAEVLHMNRRARQALRGEAPLQVLAGSLRTAQPQDLLRLHTALHDATRRGLRRLLCLGRGAGLQVAALVPVEAGMAALLLGRSDCGATLAIECFAQLYGLTAAETRVLQALSRGTAPLTIAREQGVKLSTVRTQIGALRQKTGAATITALVRLVAGLPPMASALHAH